MPRNIKDRFTNIAVITVCLALVGIIIWIDLVSSIWQDVVVLSGIAAGLVTFLLTVFVLDKALARSTARRWAPLHHLATTDFLHAMADDTHSEVSRGHVVVRQFTAPACGPADPSYIPELERLRKAVVAERGRLSALVSRWAPSLTSNGENENVLLHTAALSLSFDEIRDAALEAEALRDEASHEVLLRELEACNLNLVKLVNELRSRLELPAERRS